MKKVIFMSVVFVFVIEKTNAQTTYLDQLNHNRNQVNKFAMITLGSWALGNMAVNGALYRSGARDQKYFYQMNIAWNAVNLAIAGLGLYKALNPETTLTLFASMREQANTEKFLLFNAGLDVGYMMTGMYLIEKSKNSAKHMHRLKGYGKSLILQGGFLFLFDLTVYFIHAGNHELKQFLLSNLIVTEQGIGLVFNF